MIQVSQNFNTCAYKEISAKKADLKESGKPSNGIFRLKLNRKSGVYKKLFHLEVLRSAFTLYLHYRFEKGFEEIKEIIIVKFAGD